MFFKLFTVVYKICIVDHTLFAEFRKLRIFWDGGNMIFSFFKVYSSCLSFPPVGPEVQGTRPVLVTFENFKDREDVLKNSKVGLKNLKV